MPTNETLITAGVDVGSSAIKAAIMENHPDGSATMLSGLVERVRRRDLIRVATDVFENALRETGLEAEQLAYVATTGEGELVPFRTGHFYGMTAHARGGLFLDPEARGIVDVGALHARAVCFDEQAKVLGYRMTSQCASGSGQFLENIGRYIGVTLDEIGPKSVEADAPESCSSICAVLAETDVINMVSRGISVPNILAGIHESMAGRYTRLLSTLRMPKCVVLITGGLACDIGLLKAMQKSGEDRKLDIEIRIHEHSVLAGAIGAALWGAFRVRKLAREGRAVEAA